jgi:uracil-DNA glycosylase
MKRRSARDYLPDSNSLTALRKAAANCRGCDLYKFATQTVFGEGAQSARIMLVGEQPGDVEDKEGHPFVGPAGKLLHRAMREAGLELTAVYVTNVVKHFKYTWRGKRRIHAKPKRVEVVACMPWLEAEITRIKPRLVVALGATAAQGLLGPKFRLTQHRGEQVPSQFNVPVLATIHPSAILRASDRRARSEALKGFIEDLKTARRIARRLRS